MEYIGVVLHGILGISSYRPFVSLSLLSPLSLLFSPTILGISVEAGSFATLHSCALRSTFGLYDKLVDPVFFGVHGSNSFLISLLLVSFSLTPLRNLYFLLLVGRACFGGCGVHILHFLCSFSIPSPYRVRLVDFSSFLAGRWAVQYIQKQKTLWERLVSRGK
ncbi:hypothetical protein J3F84DRAFT_330431 [Trichoderma pleuroticola]